MTQVMGNMVLQSRPSKHQAGGSNPSGVATSFLNKFIQLVSYVQHEFASSIVTVRYLLNRDGDRRFVQNSFSEFCPICGLAGAISCPHFGVGQVPTLFQSHVKHIFCKASFFMGGLCGC
jgi:hypothetical protein